MTPSIKGVARTPSPGARAAPSAGVGQPGRHPSRPGFLLLVALLWIVVGVVVLTSLDASWKFIPGVVSIGIGLLFLRGALATIARRSP